LAPIIIDAGRLEVTTQEAASAPDVLAALEGRLFASVPEAAVVLRSDPRSVRRSIDAGEIPAQPVGPRKLVPVEWLRKAAGL
jgi:hypothetical protein